MGHAKAILGASGEEQQKIVHDRVLKEKLTVRQTEEAVQKRASGAKGPFDSSDCHLDHIADKIQEKLGTKVTMQGKGRKGRISIDYYNLDDLDRLLELLEIRVS